MTVEMITEDIMNDMEAIAECMNIKSLMLEALQRLDKVQTEAIKRNTKREKQIRDIRKFENCVISNYFEQNGKELEDE